ncbi:MAG: hypothetical protein Q9222_002408 [Ikaeria aurantiellina]
MASAVETRMTQLKLQTDLEPIADAAGWGTSEGDEHFKRQRAAADDETDKLQEYRFHTIHLEIGRQLRAVGAFDVDSESPSAIKALNLCMAPGAYTAIILEQHPDAAISGITLPSKVGGHKMIIHYGQYDPRVEVRFMDITMLLSKFKGKVIGIPRGHPDAMNFVESSPFVGQTYDLVLCDGQTLRTHKKAGYRETREPRRLLAAQVVFGMTRLNPGGTFVILLHKADAYDTMKLLRDFCSFADVELFKPEAAHQQRSTFYMIAKRVQSTCAEARRFIEDWQDAWIQATFGGDAGTGIDRATPEKAEVDALLEEFGPQLMNMAREIWSIQAKALQRSKWLPRPSDTPRSPIIESPHVKGDRGSLHASRSNTTASTPSNITKSTWRPTANEELRPSASPMKARSGNSARQTSYNAVSDEKLKKMAGRWR